MRKLGVSPPDGKFRARVLFAIFSNPGSYPPLVHAAHILAEHGAELRVIGVDVARTRHLVVPPHPNILVELIRENHGPKRQYMRWLRAVMREIRSWHPDIVYAHDPLAAPIGIIASSLHCDVVYHEHDSPATRSKKFDPFATLINQARTSLGHRAALCICPGEERLAHFRNDTHATAELFSVRNCPRAPDEETGRGVRGSDAGRNVLYYQGNLGPDRLPCSVLDALTILAPATHLLVVGYEAPGAPGYIATFLERAGRLGVAGRVSVLEQVGPEEGARLAAASHVGLLLMSPDGHDPNMLNLVGASNKLYEYMAAGLPVLANHATTLGQFVEAQGVGLSCDISNPAAIAAAATHLIRSAEGRAMGARGRDLIATRWNYDNEFAPVLRRLKNLTGRGSVLGE